MAHPTNITEVCSFLGFTNYHCTNSLGNMHRWSKHLYKLISGENMQQENEIQSNGIMSVKKHLTNLKSCALVHQFWLMQISRNCLGCIQMQAFSALEQFYIRNKMVMKRLLVMPVSYYQNLNQNIQSINWNFSA